MRRLTTGCVLALAVAFLMGCGGNSAPVPSSGNTGGNNGGQKPGLTVAAPDSHTPKSSSIVPGEVSLVAGGTRAQLDATVAKYGYSVLDFKNGVATVQVPAGTESVAATTLTKEYNIIRAQPVGVYHLANAHYNMASVKKSSFYPPAPYYNDQVTGFNYDGTNTTISNGFIGQAQPLNMMGFNAAWDVSMSTAVVTQPVKIAVIDAGFWDFSDVNNPQPGLDTALLDAVNSGHVDETGTFTAGFGPTGSMWDTYVDGNGITTPVRETGAIMFGILAANPFTYAPNAFDINGDTVITSDEVWNEGIAGINAGVDLNNNFTGGTSYVLIKTGKVDNSTTPPSWTVNDNEIAKSIDHAVASGANIILFGLTANAPVAPVVSTAIQNAHDNNILFVAPAGDVVESFNGSGFDDTPVDITTTPVTPSSDVNALSVACSGLGRITDTSLPDVDFGGGPIANNGDGWDRSMTFSAPFDSTWNETASFSNTGAKIAAVGFGMGFASHPFLTNNSATFPGFNYGYTINRFGTNVAAAYVAGSASQIYQILKDVNGGTPPTVDDLTNELLNTVQLRGAFTGVDDPNLPGPDDGGLLNAGLAATSAINGGNLVTTLPALAFTAVGGDPASWLSQPNDAVTRGTDLSVAPTVSNGTAPFTLTVDWGDGSAPQVTNNWTNGDPVTLTGGYSTLGFYQITVTVKDSNGLTATAPIAVHVIDPLSANITISDAAGASVAPGTLKAGTTYRFNANPSNAYTGDGNVITYSWDFNGDNTPDASGPSPTFSFPAAGSFAVNLTITETKRPNTLRTLAVTVVP